MTLLIEHVSTKRGEPQIPSTFCQLGLGTATYATQWAEQHQPKHTHITWTHKRVPLSYPWSEPHTPSYKSTDADNSFSLGSRQL